MKKYMLLTWNKYLEKRFYIWKLIKKGEYTRLSVTKWK